VAVSLTALSVRWSFLAEPQSSFLIATSKSTDDRDGHYSHAARCPDLSSVSFRFEIFALELAIDLSCLGDQLFGDGL
jgi:hypothetical protein